MKALLLSLLPSCALITPDEAHVSYGNGDLSGDLDRIGLSSDLDLTTFGLTWYLTDPANIRDVVPCSLLHEPLPPLEDGTTVPTVESVEKLDSEPWWAGRLDQILAFVLGSGALAGGLWGHKRLRKES